MVAAQGKVLRYANGVVGDVTNLMQRYSSVTKMWLVSENNVFLLVNRWHGGPNALLYSMGDADSTSDALAQNTSMSTHKPGDLFVEQFLPTFSKPTDTTWIQDVLMPKATYADTIRALGPPVVRVWYPPPGQTAAFNQICCTRAVSMNGTLAWTGMQTSGGKIVMGAAQAAKTSDGNFSFVVLVTSSLDSLNGWLQDQWPISIPSGRGAAILILQDGRIMGTSLLGDEVQILGSSITDSTHLYLVAITPLLLQEGFIDVTKRQPIFAQATGAEPLPPTRPTEGHSLSIGGSSYRLHVSLYNVVADSLANCRR
jgi:hypothetical protein